MADSKPSSQGHFSVTIEIEGPDLKQLTQEAGGHRLQRNPPSEKRGRIHTSTVTVSVTDNVETTEVLIKDNDLVIEWFSGTGCGGQRRNKVQSSCRVRHIPTGIVCSAQTRSRENSKKEAINELTKKVNSLLNTRYFKVQSKIKKDQVGSGMRGDKIRTIRFQDNIAIDHKSSKQITAIDYMKGYMDKLWI